MSVWEDLISVFIYDWISVWEDIISVCLFIWKSVWEDLISVCIDDWISVWEDIISVCLFIWESVWEDLISVCIDDWISVWEDIISVCLFIWESVWEDLISVCIYERLFVDSCSFILVWKSKFWDSDIISFNLSVIFSEGCSVCLFVYILVIMSVSFSVKFSLNSKLLISVFSFSLVVSISSISSVDFSVGIVSFSFKQFFCFFPLSSIPIIYS